MRPEMQPISKFPKQTAASDSALDDLVRAVSQPMIEAEIIEYFIGADIESAPHREEWLSCSGETLRAIWCHSWSTRPAEVSRVLDSGSPSTTGHAFAAPKTQRPCASNQIAKV